MNTVALAFPEPEEDPFGEEIYSYTRTQALEDGVLVDVTETAREVGFKIPVAITEALHHRLEPTKVDQALGQDYDARLWDVLWVAAFTIKLANRATETTTFVVNQQEVDAKSGEVRSLDLRLWAVCGPGDHGEPVVTIGFPDDF